MKTFLANILQQLNMRLNRGALFILGLVFILAGVGLVANAGPKFSDNDPDRGTTIVHADLFGDSFNRVVYLDQSWNNAESLWFYNTTQGSNLIPYDFFMVLEKASSQELFRSDENLNQYRYLLQKATTSNPEALPVGFVADIYKNKKYLGFTCAACHTAQINYNNTAIRIDGGPALADMQTFMADLSQALLATRNDSAKQARFVTAVLARGYYQNEAEVLADLDAFTVRIGLLDLSNRGYSEAEKSQYGYGRLDAFGRIYNRVLTHILSQDDLRTLLAGILPEAQINEVLANLEEKVLSNQSRDHLLEQLATLLTYEQQAQLAQKVFNPANAPVSYPYLWDTPQHDYVQWNGVGSNAGLGPLGRNVGEVIGVFGTMDWSEEPGWTVSSWLAGQGAFTKQHLSFNSSIDIHNLNLLESQISKLQSPVWPSDILPPLDTTRLGRGEAIFNTHCAACHQPIVRDDPNRHVITNFTDVNSVGTDATMASNSVNWTGWSGILTNQYADVGIGKMYLKDRMPAFVLLRVATLNTVLATSDPDKWFFERWADQVYDAVFLEPNTIKPSLKMGDYVPDTTNNPFASLMAYKGRSLNGIWATAPYLHNGSVPTLYDLLLPASERPKTFLVGSREFDPVKVGFKSTGYAGFNFDTSLPGNSNAGHEYGTYDVILPDGTVVKALTEEDRLDLLEYLKSQ
jgi:hypothetical protein